MKNKIFLLAFLLFALTIVVIYLLSPRAVWRTYGDDSLGYSFELPRADVRALGWLKPSEADINQGVVTSLGYEEGFFLQIYRPIVAPKLDFLALGRRVYEQGIKHDRTRYYRNGRIGQFGGVKAFIFDTQAKFNDRDHDYAYWLPDRIFDANEAKDDQPPTDARVVYASHKGRCYRIIYDPHSRNGRRTAGSFRFFYL